MRSVCCAYVKVALDKSNNKLWALVHAVHMRGFIYNFALYEIAMRLHRRICSFFRRMAAICDRETLFSAICNPVVRQCLMRYSNGCEKKKKYMHMRRGLDFLLHSATKISLEFHLICR